MSYFPPELTTVLYIRLWFSNLHVSYQKCSRQNRTYFPKETRMKKWYHENCWHLIKPKQQIETCRTTEMTKTKRLKRNEPNDSNEKTKNDQNSTKKKKISEIKITPRGHLNYVLLLIYLMGKFSYLYITISLTWDVEGTFLKKISIQRSRT